MPYSTRYIIEQLARGRPMPQGRPEDSLFRALERLSHQDAERAIHQGASVGGRNGRNESPLEVVVRAARTQARGEVLLRASLCLEALLRAGRPTLPRGRWGADTLIQAGRLVALDRRNQMRWLEAWRRVAGGPQAWIMPGTDGTRPLDQWKTNAGPELLKQLEQLEPRPRAPRPPGM